VRGNRPDVARHRDRPASLSSTRVITTVSTEAKAELSRRAGAVDVLGYPDDPATFGAKIRALTDPTARRSPSSTAT
jgi:hypothetical protein